VCRGRVMLAQEAAAAGAGAAARRPQPQPHRLRACCGLEAAWSAWDSAPQGRQRNREHDGGQQAAPWRTTVAITPPPSAPSVPQGPARAFGLLRGTTCRAVTHCWPAGEGRGPGGLRAAAAAPRRSWVCRLWGAPAHRGQQRWAAPGPCDLVQCKRRDGRLSAGQGTAAAAAGLRRRGATCLGWPRRASAAFLGTLDGPVTRLRCNRGSAAADAGL
jgi:hypothetical protein